VVWLAFWFGVQSQRNCLAEGVSFGVEQECYYKFSSETLLMIYSCKLEIHIKGPRPTSLRIRRHFYTKFQHLPNTKLDGRYVTGAVTRLRREEPGNYLTKEHIFSIQVNPWPWCDKRRRCVPLKHKINAFCSAARELTQPSAYYSETWVLLF